jgi:hypothetical protein
VLRNGDDAIRQYFAFARDNPGRYAVSLLT